jgi:hypothetical protein
MDGINNVFGKRGLSMCRIASLSLLQKLKESMFLGLKKLAYLGFQYLDHPPYSPDLAPSDYHLFLGPKKQLKGRHFSSDPEAIPTAESWLDR